LYCFLDCSGTKESKGLTIDRAVTPTFVWHQMAELAHINTRKSSLTPFYLGFVRGGFPFKKLKASDYFEVRMHMFDEWK